MCCCHSHGLSNISRTAAWIQSAWRTVSCHYFYSVLRTLRRRWTKYQTDCCWACWKFTWIYRHFWAILLFYFVILVCVGSTVAWRVVAERTPVAGSTSCWDAAAQRPWAKLTLCLCRRAVGLYLSYRCKNWKYNGQVVEVVWSAWRKLTAKTTKRRQAPQSCHAELCEDNADYRVTL